MHTRHPLASPTAWHGRVHDFLEAESEAIVSALHARHRATDEQIIAWVETIRALARSLREVSNSNREAGDWWIAFEYELPREGGRRPDVCIVTTSDVLVIEVKATGKPTQEAVEQCRAYVRDLREYHEACHGANVRGLLLVTRWAGSTRLDSIDVCGPARIPAVLHQLRGAGPSPNLVDLWLAAPYAPLPSLVAAARMLFEREKLPEIRRAKSAGVHEAVRTLGTIAERARNSGSHHLVLISGSPGAGKTLVGLQFVHDHRSGSEDKVPAVFLSGNGPLVEVLQHVLGTKVFVQDVHRFMWEYGVRGLTASPEEVLIFDEAQRAWDREKVEAWYREKKGIEHRQSEPETFVRIVGARPAGGVLVGLIGYGQEIHNGEEAGIAQWADAIAAHGGEWTIHCAGRLRDFFQGFVVEEHGALDLNESLRSHAADELHLWVEHLLEGRLDEAGRLSERLTNAGFSLWMTSDLGLARRFVVDRYAPEATKTYGLLASSKSKNLAKYGLDTTFGSPLVLRPGQVGRWFHGAPPRCRELASVATEFQCQGLELDGGLLLWGNDLVWKDERWMIPRYSRAQARDPQRLRKNSYRVLLTRFRDGIVVYVPPDVEMGDTFSALRRAGFRPLGVDLSAVEEAGTPGGS